MARNKSVRQTKPNTIRSEMQKPENRFERNRREQKELAERLCLKSASSQTLFRGCTVP